MQFALISCCCLASLPADHRAKFQIFALRLCFFILHMHFDPLVKLRKEPLWIVAEYEAETCRLVNFEKQ